jgi:hypothetical protein
MGYNKPKETTRNYLENAPLPNHGKSYTVISHKQVIDNTIQLLADSGFVIQKELYRANMNANVAQGIYHILPINTVDPTIMEEKELGMMFAWTNSYDKSTRFQCAIGAYVMVCHNGMVAGDMMNFRRKHTGSADHDIRMQISNQIKNGEKYYKRILTDRDAMRNTELSLQEQAEIAGRLYINEDILDAAQMSCVKAELEKPSYDYQCDQENAWTFYNHVTHALKKAHPRDWLSDSQNFHDFMTARVLSKMNITMNDALDLSEFDTTQDGNLDITMEEWNENAIEVDEDITPSKLVQDVYLMRD